MRLLESSKSKSRATFLALWITIFAAFIFLKGVLLPFLLAALIAYVLHPVVKRLVNLQVAGLSMPRFAAVLILYVFIGTFLYLLSAYFFPELYREATRLGKDISLFLKALDEGGIQKLSLGIQGFFEKYNLPVHLETPFISPESEVNGDKLLSFNLPDLFKKLTKDLVLTLKSQSFQIVVVLQNLVADVLRFVFNFFLVFMLTAFLLVDTKKITNFLISLIPRPDKKRFKAFLGRLDTGLAGVVRGQLTICVINALLTLAGLLIFKIKFAFILATIAGIFSLIPIFGSILSTLPIVLIAVTQSAMSALLIFVWILLIHALEANFLNPKVLGTAAKIHPILIVLALITGEHFYGIVGALLAVPIASMLVTIFRSAQKWASSMEQGLEMPK